MTARVLLILAAMAATPALAQPIIIPLNKDTDSPRTPEPQAPPVAPPQAGPSMPDSSAAQPTQPGTSADQAAQPPASR